MALYYGKKSAWKFHSGSEVSGGAGLMEFLSFGGSNGKVVARSSSSRIHLEYCFAGVSVGAGISVLGPISIGSGKMSEHAGQLRNW